MRFFLVMLAATLITRGQDEIGRSPNLFPGDLAVLESEEVRKDIGCTVVPAKALLGFDMKFHSGFSVDVPMRDLVGPRNLLSIVFRVASKDHLQDPLYFQQRIQVPSITGDRGTATLEGSFDLGEGPYHVNWLLRDSSGRVCSTLWDVDATRTYKDREVELVLAPGTVRHADKDQFQPEPPVARSAEQPPLNIKVLMNFAPQRPDSTILAPSERLALISILRGLSRSPRIGGFSLVVFNLGQQRIFYRQDAGNGIDFPKLGRSLKDVNLGTVELSQLEKKHADTDFLSALCKKETTDSSIDGLVFVGPKAMLDANVPDEDLKQIGDLEYPVFYMNYSADPAAVPWKDSISRVVRFFKGREYTISGPRDLWNAVTEVVSRIAKSHQTRLRAATGP